MCPIRTLCSDVALKKTRVMRHMRVARISFAGGGAQSTWGPVARRTPMGVGAKSRRGLRASAFKAVDFWTLSEAF